MVVEAGVGEMLAAAPMPQSEGANGQPQREAACRGVARPTPPYDAPRHALHGGVRNDGGLRDRHHVCVQKREI